MAKQMVINEKKEVEVAGKLPIKGLGIQGLEDYDATVMPVPYVRIVQDQSKEIKMENGVDAPAGSFFFSDTREALMVLKFILLKSKPVTVDFERDGVVKKTPLRKLLGILVDTKKVFVLTIPVTSFSNFGRLVSIMFATGMKATWEKVITATTTKEENDKGKFHVVHFELGEALTEEQKIEMTMAFEEWKRILDSNPNEEDGKHKLPFE